MILKWTQIRERPCQFISTNRFQHKLSELSKKERSCSSRSFCQRFVTNYIQLNHWSRSLRNFGRVYRLDGVMNKCSCYVGAEKLTLSDLARDFYLIIQIYLVQRREIMRKTTNELYTPTQRRGNKLKELHRELRSLYFVSSLHRPTQLFFLTIFMYRKKAHSKLFRYLQFKHEWIFTLRWSAW